MTAWVSLAFFLLGLFLSTLVSILLKKDEPLKLTTGQFLKSLKIE